MNAGKVVAFLTALTMPIMLAAMLLAHSASAAPQTYSNSAYDLTQAYAWDSGSGTCISPCHVPHVGFTSHFATTMNTAQGMLHYWTPLTSGQYVVSPPFTPAVGQSVGVICWTTSTNLGVVDKIDARFTASVNTSPPISGNYLWIGYEDDDFVNLSYSDRMNYVPHC